MRERRNQLRKDYVGLGSLRRNVDEELHVNKQRESILQNQYAKSLEKMAKLESIKLKLNEVKETEYQV